ncbi:MAG: beta-Ala-His dipeptidase [Defluviitaleaceae bacterium]|nr:beta-Ala-His dipeptidase [Defluviitaleaceae bacterium]MCL2262182.1 beta-Ala-His dipeptidase [Defluviitaleaceae bacterium]
MNQLEPKVVFSNFYEISKIPRGSGNEKAVSDYVAEFARQNRAEVAQDDWNNLIIKKSAAGFEGKEPIILQAHLDMVCEKNADTQHDFTRDPLDLYVDGDYLQARGTTLGADNGIGVAMCMALIAGKFEHPPLEIILTTEEETGMSGAENLDISGLKGTRMLNLDSSDDTTFTMGCAAGTTAEITIPITRNHAEISAPVCCKISVKGLKGGHSGGDINQERGNALRILGFLLDAAYTGGDVFLSEISGGMKVNAIPREATATIIFPSSDKEAVTKNLNELAANFSEQFRATDSGLKIAHDISDCQTQNISVLTKENTRKVISALLLIPTGVISESREIDGLVNASCNIGVAETAADYVKISAMPRGAASFYTRQIEAQISALAEYLGAELNFLQRSPAWPYNPNSALLKTAQQAYKSLFSREALATAVHGGLECGIFSAKFAEKNISLDIISFGPNAHDYHTPGERLSISSTARAWEFLLKLLKTI